MKTNEEINRYFTKVIKGYSREVPVPTHWTCDSKIAFENKDGDLTCPQCQLYDYFSKEGFWDIKEWICKPKNSHLLWEMFSNGYMDLKDLDYKTFARDVYNFLEGKK